MRTEGSEEEDDAGGKLIKFDSLFTKPSGFGFGFGSGFGFINAVVTANMVLQ